MKSRPARSQTSGNIDQKANLLEATEKEANHKGHKATQRTQKENPSSEL
jgi:hypothetical protein